MNPSRSSRASRGSRGTSRGATNIRGSSSTRSNIASRGGIRKHTLTRIDKDGDLDMDGANRGRGGGRGGNRGRGGRNSITPQPNTQQLERAMENGGNGQAEVRVNDYSRELRVTGWHNSKASSNPDGGLQSLTDFLNKKASASGQRFKLSKVCPSSPCGQSNLRSDFDLLDARSLQAYPQHQGASLTKSIVTCVG